MARVSRRHLSGLCHYKCSRPATTWDHIIPKEFGGPRGRNLVRACESCNNKKASKPPTCTCDRCREAVRSWQRYILPQELVKYPAGSNKRRRLLLFAFDVACIYYDYNNKEASSLT